MAGAGQSLSILTSARSVDLYGADIQERVRQATDGVWQVRWLTPEAQGAAVAAGALLDGQVAYHTRDITGESTKGRVLPDLQRYYDLLHASPQLRWLHAHSSGVDRPIFALLRGRGVRVTTSSGTNVEPLAHTAVAAVLMLARRFPELAQAQREQRWTSLVDRADVRDLTGQVVLVVGQGPIGQAIARMLQALGLRVWAARSSHQQAAAPIERSLLYEEMADCAPSVQHLVLACPLTDRTRGLVDARLLARLPPGTSVVNVARGEVIDQTALVAALGTGRLGGAFLDVFESEPLAPGHALWTLPNVVISPHTAGHFAEQAQRVHQRFVDNLLHYIAGQPLINEIP